MPNAVNIPISLRELPWLAKKWALRLMQSAWTLNDWLLILGLTVTAALGVWLAVRFLAWRKQRLANDPQRLFRELCRAHRLGRGEVAVLRKLVRIEHVDPPARIFLEPRRFKPTAETLLAGSEQQLDRLRERLFGNLAS